MVRPLFMVNMQLGGLFTYHGVLSEGADLLDGTRGALLEGDTVHLLIASID
jgi:hypothetical protein